MSKNAYKWMRPGLTTPTQRATWPVAVGEWTHPETPMLCESGWHAMEEKDVLAHLPDTIGAELWWVEYGGRVVHGADKFCSERMRLVSLAGVTTEENLRLFAADCAEDALSLVESPDPRSVEAIRVARLYAVGEATQGELAAARAAARAAAWAAAWDATRDAAGAAARDAARDAARAKYSNWLVVRLESGY